MTPRIFPLYAIRRDSSGTPLCDCDDPSCGDIGKHPRVAWRSWQGIEVDKGGGSGICTGGDFLVVDLDRKNGVDGVAALETLCAGRDLPDTLTVYTPSGGVHLYYSKPEEIWVGNSRSKLGPGIDIRGDGGFAVCPDSPHANGGIYRAENPDAAVTPAPAWLLAEIIRVSPKKPEIKSKNAAIDPDSEAGRKAVAWVKNKLSEAKPSISGDGGSNVFFNICCDLVVSMLPLDILQDLIESEYNHKCEPPWSSSEISHKLMDADELSDRVRGLPSEGLINSLLDRAPPEEKTKNVVYETLEGEEVQAVFEDTCQFHNGETRKTSIGEIAAELRYHNKWLSVLQYDDLRKWITAKGGPIALDAHRGNITSVDYTRMRAWFELNGKKAGKEDICDAVEMVAKESKYNPILQYLDSLSGTEEKPGRFYGMEEASAKSSALSLLCQKALGNDSALASDVLQKMLIAAVRRMRHPGTKVDNILILKGKQGIRKSTFLSELFGYQYIRSQLADLATKDASIGLRGMWAIELAELDKIIRTESSTVKEFLSRPYDNYRPPYGKSDEQFPRQCVFFATTNDDRFLTDATGNRRFWVIEVNGYDIPWLREHRDEIWAAANVLDAASVPHWFEGEEEAADLRDSYETFDEWDDLVKDYCSGRTMITNARDFFLEVIAKGDRSADLKLDQKVQRRIWEIFRRFGLERKKVHGKCWVDVPKWLTDTEPSPEETVRRADAKTRGEISGGFMPTAVK